MEILTTERLTLKTWTRADLPLAIQLWGDPKVMQFVDGSKVLSESEAAARIELEIMRQRTHGVQYWPTFERKSGDFIGAIGLRPWTYTPTQCFELGAHLVSTKWRMGYAAEATRAVIAYAFEELGESLIMTGHHPANRASKALIKSLGFTWVQDAYYPASGLMHPSYELRRADIYRLPYRTELGICDLTIGIDIRSPIKFRCGVEFL